MQEQPSPSGSRQGEGEAHDLKADLAKLAQDPTDDLKAGLAKLALEAAPEPSHLGARLRNYFLTGLVVVGPVTITLYTAWYFINMVDAWVKPISRPSTIPNPTCPSTSLAWDSSLPSSVLPSSARRPPNLSAVPLFA